MRTGFLSTAILSCLLAGHSAPAQTPASSPSRQAAAPVPVGVARGKKLVLKNGDFQLVREFQRNGERVRYFSLERGAWEEVPAAMVDWDATKKSEAAAAAEADATAKQIKQREDSSRMDMALDVDASLQVGSGAFLPPGEGMFAIEGKAVTPLEQVASQTKRDKKQLLKQVISPVPIVPSKTNVELLGAHAKIRLDPAHLEFYLREAPPDPGSNTPIRKSSEPGVFGPEVELVHATVKGGKRQLEQIKALFGEKLADERKTVLLQRWQVAANVFRFTLGEPLPPGEYALAEILPDGMNLYVWDFGVDKTQAKEADKK
jgi:hypothetical protein